MTVWDFFVRMCCSCFRGRGRVADEPAIVYRSNASSSDDEFNILDSYSNSVTNDGTSEILVGNGDASSSDDEFNILASSSNSVTNDGSSEILVGNGDAYNQYVAARRANNGKISQFQAMTICRNISMLQVRTN